MSSTSRIASRRAAPAAVAALITVAGCGNGTGEGAGENAGSAAPGAGSGAASSGRVTGTITVMAAASLKESFTSLARTFEQQHPGTKVVLSFGPSSGLAGQITQGAPADVFASASRKNMDQVTQAGDAASPTTFARNQLTIVTPASNPAKVRGLSDLTKPSVKTAVCQAQVPCGVVAATVFRNAGVTVKPVTQEVDVKAVLSKVTLGEVDAGLVYVTDAKAAGTKVAQVAIPADDNASTDYPIAPLTGSKNPATAKAFVDLVLSQTGRQVLTGAGFAAPS
ncbi:MULTISPECIES: molybdate ABC transporter substrate-binding protein [Barrientosiimonas]|uniref:Molybdate-binding protein n=1 Tax=Barrientosiimonas endolithica TaxID=1535208 RepID=A0ABM8HF24_9MICO|nr:molybdate ABC transporter substrate-binding protein [Barrientosiimonas endolithica]BDZ59623.1 molybdate-binding protein [Barrientosiimonas endolithica]